MSLRRGRRARRSPLVDALPAGRFTLGGAAGDGVSLQLLLVDALPAGRFTLGGAAVAVAVAV